MKLMIAAGQEEEESQLEMLLEIIKTPYVVSDCWGLDHAEVVHVLECELSKKKMLYRTHS